jgi:Acyltransferase family
MSKSSLALSNLRAFVILLVVAFHSVLAYLGSQPASPSPFDSPPYWWRAIPIIDSERWFGFDLFCAFTYVYMMQLMFFLSGLFVWPSLLRKGGKIFLYDRFRAIAPGPRNVELDIAEFGQEMAPIITIATIGSIVSLEPLEIAVHRRRHLIFDDFLQGLPAKGTITLAPLQTVRLHCLHDFKCHR